jgi:hypothetical protein
MTVLFLVSTNLATWAATRRALRSSAWVVDSAIVSALPPLAFPTPFRRRFAVRGHFAFRTTSLRTIATWGAFKAQETNEYSNPRYLEFWDRQIEDLRKAGMPED